MTRQTSWLAVSVLAALAGSAWGQASKPSDNELLKGPSVKEQSVPGENRKFSSGQPDRKDRLKQEVPHRLFVRSFEVLRSESADPSVRLSSEQNAKLDRIEQDFRDAVKAYGQQHHDELIKIRDSLPAGEARSRLNAFLSGQPAAGSDNGKKPGKGHKAGEKQAGKEGNTTMPDTAGDQSAGAMKERLKELLSGAPKPEETHAKMWAVLTDAQKPVVQKELDRIREQVKQRRDGKTAKGQPAAGDVDLASLPPKLRARLEQMTPEQRAEAIQKYRERKAAEPK